MSEKSPDETASHSLFMSPSVVASSSITGTPHQPRKHASIRPLTAAYNAAASDQTVCWTLVVSEFGFILIYIHLFV